MRDVISYLPGEVLLEITHILNWMPEAQGEGGRLQLLPTLTPEDQRKWLANNCAVLMKEIRLTAGHTIANLWRRFRSKEPVSYNELLADIAKKLDAQPCTCSDELLEERIVRKLWNQTLSGLTQEQREELIRKAREEAEKHGLAPAAVVGSAALGAGLLGSHLAGFGLYLAASTILGTINSTLGLGLGFGAFMGMSSLIHLALGPVGWIGFIASLFVGLGGPNYKKLIPIVFTITAYRQDLRVRLAKAFDSYDSGQWIAVLGDAPSDPTLRKNRVDFLQRISESAQTEWPGESRWILLSSTMSFVKGNDCSAQEIVTWFRSESKKDLSSASRIATQLGRYVSELEPDRADALTGLFLDADPRLAKVSYTLAPEFGSTHHRSIIELANQLVTEIGPK